MKSAGQSRATTVLFFLFFLGLAVTVFALVDLHWTHSVFVKEHAASRSQQERP